MEKESSFFVPLNGGNQYLYAKTEAEAREEAQTIADWRKETVYLYKKAIPAKKGAPIRHNELLGVFPPCL